MKLTIVLPHPPASVRPNGGHGNRYAKADAIRLYRRRAKLEAILALARNPPPMWKQASLRITWRSKTKTHPDPTNLCGMMKAAIDGLQDAGIIENDKGLWPERPVIETAAHWPEVVLTVEGEA